MPVLAHRLIVAMALLALLPSCRMLSSLGFGSNGSGTDGPAVPDGETASRDATADAEADASSAQPRADAHTLPGSGGVADPDSAAKTRAESRMGPPIPLRFFLPPLACGPPLPPMPVDGDYPAVRVDGATVALARIVDGGSGVLIDNDGTQPRSWEQKFIRRGDIPRGYFNVRKIDTNSDGRFDDELTAINGIWEMDHAGNISRK